MSGPTPFKTCLRVAALCLSASVATMPAHAELLTPARWAALDRAEKSDDWQDAKPEALLARLAQVTQRKAAAGDKVQREYQLHQLLKRLQAAPPPEGGEALVQSLLDEPVIAQAALEDGGRIVRVPAFPVAAAARATLNSWSRDAYRAEFLDRLATGKPLTWPQDPLAAAAAIDALQHAPALPMTRGGETVLRGAQWPSAVRLALARRLGTAQGYRRWQQAAMAQRAAASEVRDGLDAATADLNPEAARALIMEFATTGRWASVATHALSAHGGDASAALSSDVEAALGEALSDPARGVDAALALGRAGRVLQLEAVALDAAATVPARAAAIVGLWQAGRRDVLAQLANDPTLPAHMRAEIQRWLQS